MLINANYSACLNIKASTTSNLEEVINPSFLDINNGTGSVQVELPVKQVNTTSEIQVSAASQLQQPNISPILQVITVSPLLRSSSDYEKTETDQLMHGEGWHFENGTLTLGDKVDGILQEPKKDNGTGKTIWPWDYLRSQVTKVDIKNEVKINTASSMFANMPQLSTVNGLNKLDSIKYMNAMFDGDWTLTDVDVSNWDLTQVKECYYLFSGCRSLTTIKGEFSTSSFQNTTTMSAMFFNCSALTNVDVSKWDVGNVQNFFAMFKECSALQSIKGLDNWNTTAATNMSYMFYDCTNLTSIASSNPGENPSTNVSYTSASENLGNLDFSNFGTAKVEDFSYMFYDCKAMRSIKGLDNWNTKSATDMSYMFTYDDNLNSLDLSKFDTSQVTTFKAMFAGCAKLASIAGLNNWNTKSATDMSSMFTYDDNLNSLDLSKFDTSQVTTFKAMFAGCAKLASIAGLNNWNTKSATDMSSMFTYDDNLNSLDLSKFDTSQVTTFKAMFAGCAKLASIAGLNNWNTKSATDMSSMFAYDKSLQKLDLSGFDTTTKNATQDNLFSEDTNLWYLKIGKATELKNDCGLPEAPKDTYFPSEFPKESENPKNPKYKTSQNGKWQKVIKKEGDDYWWQPNDDIYTNDELIKDSQFNNYKLFIWQPAFSQTTKGSLVLTVSPNARFDIILGNNKNKFSVDNKKTLSYTVSDSSNAQWQLYAMMTKFKNNDPSSNTVLSIDTLSLSLKDEEGSEQRKYDLNQQPTLIRTSADIPLKWDLRSVLNVGNLDKIKNDGSSGTKTYTTTIDYDLVNSIQ